MSLKFRITSSAVAIAATLTSCAVGPDYAGAPQFAPASISRGAFRSETKNQAAQYPVAAWWEDVRDPDLTKAIQTAFVRSPNVDTGLARLRQARAQLLASRAQLALQVANSSSALRARVGLGDMSDANDALSQAASGLGIATVPTIPDHLTTNLYNVGFDASWEIDIFGGRRRAVEGSIAQT